MAHRVQYRVISLAGSPRRESFFRSPEASCFEVEDAVRGADLPYSRGPLELAGHNIFLDAEHLEPPVIGCTLSHASAILKFLADDSVDYLVVAEDDCVIDQDIQSLVEEVIKHNVPGTMTLLSTSWHEAGKPLRAVDHTSFSCSLLPGRALKWGGETRRLRHITPRAHMGTSCYLIDKEAARIYADHVLERLHWEADVFPLFVMWGIRFALVTPLPFSVDTTTVSEIQGAVTVVQPYRPPENRKAAILMLLNQFQRRLRFTLQNLGDR